MRQNRKTVKVAHYPDGTRFTLRKTYGGEWEYAQGCSAYPQSQAIDSVHRLGGHIVIERNPMYREPKPEDLFRNLFGFGR